MRAKAVWSLEKFSARNAVQIGMLRLLPIMFVQAEVVLENLVT